MDNKLSKEERKRATVRKREFGTEVRIAFHNLLSLNNMILVIWSDEKTALYPRADTSVMADIRTRSATGSKIGNTRLHVRTV